MAFRSIIREFFVKRGGVMHFADPKTGDGEGADGEDVELDEAAV